MVKEIHYTGYATEPSDYECADGQLAASLNLISEDNQLKPVFQPATKLQLPDSCKVIYIHKTSSYEHYIIYNTSTSALYWIDSTAKAITLSDTNRIGSYYAISHINTVGNTLMVFTATAINYLLWKSGSYNTLGNKLPEIAISFGLIGHPRLYSCITEDGSSSKRGTFTISFNSIDKSNLYNTFTDENKTKITSQVMAKVNKFIVEQTINKGRFCFPFFVRWAYRLFDGSHMMHSAPVLMTPSTTPAPVVMWKRASGKNSYTDAECDIMMVAADLDYCLTRNGNYYDLDDWQDIISAIDIYISKPIYTYDQEGEFTSFNDDDNLDCKFIGRLYNGEKDKDTPDTTLASSVTEDRMLAPLSSTAFMSQYFEWAYKHIYALYFSTDRSVPNATLHMPEFSDDKRDENIESNSNFYKLVSLDISELVDGVGTRKTLAVKDDYLQSLTSREVMTDDYLTHDRLMASSSYGFNSRLNLSGVKRELFDGFISNAMFSFCQDVYSFNIDTSTKSVTINAGGGFTQGRMKLRVYIRENGEVYYVGADPYDTLPYLRVFVDSTSTWKSTTILSDGTRKVTTYNFSAGTKTVTMYDSSGNITSTETTHNSYKPTAFASWLFYPNNNAFKIAIYDSVRATPPFVVNLKAHDFLNGAYAFLGFKSERGLPDVTLPSATGNEWDGSAIVDVPNKIYTSEVNNPFFFPLLGINTVGSGKVLGMSTAAKALSEGQFGQFPLYAFTTDGVWALEVSSTGTYSAKQPITRDVCINADSITQLDNAVLFATDRGIMVIQGSQTSCITDNIFSEAPFNVWNDLPCVDQLHTKLGHATDACLPIKPFLGFLAGCQMIYDYVHQRVIVFNPTITDGAQQYTYAYVYSLKSKQWGMMYTNILSVINSYPDALAMTDGNALVSFSDTNEAECKGLYITRPLKLGSADIQKTVSALIQRGHFQRGDVGTVLYGSRDLFTWRLVWSSKDHYLRGFRGTPYKYFRIAGIATLTDGKSVFGASVNFEPRHTNQLR